MSLPIETTKSAGAAHLNFLIHGPAGAGKTTLLGTTGDLEHTLIISAEGGLLPLRGLDIPCIDVVAYANALSEEHNARVTIVEALKDVFRMLHKNEQGFTWVCLDSVSEIAEVCLSDEMARKNKDGEPVDGRQAYGKMANIILKMLRGFRDLPMNVIMTCQQGREQSEDGRVYKGPMLPGKKAAQKLPYLFDEVFALCLSKREDGSVQRSLLTSNDGIFEAKDRSDSLSLWEPPDLAHVASKIRGEG